MTRSTTRTACPNKTYLCEAEIDLQNNLQSPEKSTTKAELEIMKSSTIFTLSFSLILLPFSTAANPPVTSYYGECRLAEKDCKYWDATPGYFFAKLCDPVCFFYSNTRAIANLL